MESFLEYLKQELKDAEESYDIPYQSEEDYSFINGKIDALEDVIYKLETQLNDRL